MKLSPCRHIHVVPLLLLTAAGSAAAHCGSAFCVLNTDDDAVGLWVKPGLRMDVHAEFVKLDTLRSGRDKVAPAGIPGTHDEVRTLNRNLLASLDYAWTPEWAVSVQVPFVDRYHEHIHNDPVDGPVTERWRMQRLSDIRLVGRYQISGIPEHDHSSGIRFGLKLPTGSTGVRNDEGELAERTLQPGTGTTDLILGAYYNGPLGAGGASWFAQATVVSALDSYAGFRPGAQLTVNTGLSYPFGSTVSGLLQVNVSRRGRDGGSAAEPADSGGTQVFLSPGLSVAVSGTARVYGFLQLPAYQRVNGTQLTADRSFVVGWGQVF